MLIIMFCGLMDIEKRGIGSQVIHTARNWDQLVYPNYMAI
jgi:hypothetical protein